MSLTRRAFLKILSATAAAVSLADVQALVPASPRAVPVAPAVDWSKWNELAIRSRGGIIEWSVNGQVVNNHPALVKRISQILRPGGFADVCLGRSDELAIRYREKWDSVHQGTYALVDGVGHSSVGCGPRVCRVPKEVA